MRKAFVLLELVNHVALVAKAAKARGLTVVVVGQNPLPRQGPFAVPDGVVDELIPLASWSDAGAVRAVLDDLYERYEIAGTYAAFEAALPYDAELRARAGLPTSGADTLRAALDKREVRDRLRAKGLSRLRSTTLAGALRWDTWGFEGPAILKPAHGTGSALCFTVGSLDELRAAAAEIERTPPAAGTTRDCVMSGEFVLEQKARGELLSVESLVHDGEVKVVGLLGRYLPADDRVAEQAVVFPYQHPRYAEIAEAAAAFHRCLGITHGPTHLEVMVPDDGPVELIDFSLRVAGAGAVLLFGLVLGTPYEELLTDLGCGAAPDLDALSPTRGWAAECLTPPRPGTTELRDLSVPETARFVRPAREPGQRLTGRSDQLDAVVTFVVTAAFPEELHEVLLDARRRTVVNGEPLGDNPNNRLIAPQHLRAMAGLAV